MIIDCDTCTVRPHACADCAVGVLLGIPGVPGDAPEPAEPAAPGDPLPAGFGPVERRALEVLADHGLIPRLRLVPPERGADRGSGTGTSGVSGVSGTSRKRARDAG